MKKHEIETKVVDILSENLDIPPHEILPSSNLMQDLGADSLDLAELVMVIEDEFDIDIPDEDAEGLTTVNEVVEYITQHVG